MRKNNMCDKSWITPGHIVSIDTKGWVNILIISESLHEGSQIPYRRGVVVTPAEEWQYQCTDNCLIAGAAKRWMLHLWLDYPVAELDILEKVDEIIEDCDRAAIAIEAHQRGLQLEPCDGVGTEKPSMDNTASMLERLQLYDRAKTLTETIDAYTT